MASKRTVTPALHSARQALVGTAIRSTHSVAAARALRPATSRIVPRPASKTLSNSFRKTYSQSASENSKLWTFEEVEKLSKESKPDVVIVDVREPHELKSTGRIPNAINIPITSAPDSFLITNDDFEDKFGFPRPSKESEVVFYCKAGVRSRAAAGLAKAAGWTRVGEYPGSWTDWSNKGGRTERTET